MIERRILQLLPTAGLAVVCAAVGLAWVFEPALAPSGWSGRLAVLLTGVSLALLAVRVSVLQASKSAQSARRYIDQLCALEPSALSEDETADAVPLRRDDYIWRELCKKVHQRLATFARRAEELEMGRAAAEVRVRRIISERDQLRDILGGLTDPV